MGRGIFNMYGYFSGGSWSPPYTAEQVSAYNGSYNPAGVKIDSYTYRYFLRDLYQRCGYFIEWSGMPQHWLADYVNFSLIYCGYCGVLDAGAYKYGVIPQWGTLSGWGIYQQPNRLSVVNTYIQKPQMMIGKDCELLRLTPDLRGLWDVIDFYAVKLALVSKAFDMSAISAKVSYAVAAKDRVSAQTIKAIMDKAQAGEPLVVYDAAALLPTDDAFPSQPPWQEYHRDVHEGLILEETLDAMERLYHQFYTVVGIPYANTRQERTLQLQAEMDAGGTQSRVRQMIDNLERSCLRVNEMFGLNLHVKLRGGIDDAADTDAAESDAV